MLLLQGAVFIFQGLGYTRVNTPDDNILNNYFLYSKPINFE